ncbi:MAG: hypothetical protein HQK83_12870 [Fibrobacteria bacterium]|nr:hypothetical protein [Fibrobacteria bacterium]
MLKIFLLLFFVTGVSYSFFEDRITSSGYSANLGAGASTGAYRLSISHNPATLYQDHFGFALSHYSPYQLSELSVTEAGVFKDWYLWGTSFNILQTKVADIYLEHTLNIQTSIYVYKSLRFGFALNSRRLEIRNYGKTWYPGEAIGVQVQIFEKLSLGGFTTDIISQYLSNEIIIPVYQFGVSFSGPFGYSMHYDMRRENNITWRQYFSQTLNIRKILKISIGIADKPYQFSLGCAVHYKALGLFSGAQMHGKLGHTRHYAILGDFLSKNRAE